jgi:peptide/nickel transport system substrate-binding protein
MIMGMRRFVPVLVAAAMLAASACSGGSTPSSNQPAPTSGSQPAASGSQPAPTSGTQAAPAASQPTAASTQPALQTLRVGYDVSITTGDPDMTGQPTDINLLINVFDPLTRRDNSGQLQPSLAQSWKLVDPTTWEFALRPNVKFQNGEPFDANAVKFSLERVTKNPKSPIQELRSVDSITVKDPLTVDIVTKTPDPLIPDKLALFAGMMVPPQYVQQQGDANFANKPVGTGPYAVQEWVRGDHITFQANPNYWNGAPKVKTVVVRFITDPTTRVAALLNHEIDMATALPPTAVKQVESTSGLRVDKATGLRIYYVSIANKEGPLANTQVRQALSYATDTKTLTDKLLLGYGVQIGAPLATTNYGAKDAPGPYSYDVNKAKQLLAQAGYPDGFTTQFDTRSGIYQTIAETVSQMWAQVGVKATVNVLPDATYTDKYTNGTVGPVWDNGYTMWQGDPTTLIDTFFHTDRVRARYTTPQLDAQVNDLASQTDPQKRAQAMKEILTVLHDQAPWIYTFQANDLYGVSSQVQWTVPGMQLLDFSQVK